MSKPKHYWITGAYVEQSFGNITQKVYLCFNEIPSAQTKGPFTAVVEKEAYDKLKAELEEMQRNCISLSLHESRMQYQKEASDLETLGLLVQLAEAENQLQKLKGVK